MYAGVSRATKDPSETFTWSSCSSTKSQGHQQLSESHPHSCTQPCAKALPGRLTKQAPHMDTSMLQGWETLVCDPKALTHFRLFLVQTCCTLILSDHRGLEPNDIRVNPSRLSATLARSKTLGSDRRSSHDHWSCRKLVSLQTSHGITYSQARLKGFMVAIGQNCVATKGSQCKTQVTCHSVLEARPGRAVDFFGGWAAKTSDKAVHDGLSNPVAEKIARFQGLSDAN